MEHTNKVAIELLTDEFYDYPRNYWHYDTEYLLIIRAISKVKSLDGNTVKLRETCPECGEKLISHRYGDICSNIICDYEVRHVE